MTRHGKAGSGGGVDFQIEGKSATRAIVLHVDRRDRTAPVTADRAVEARLEEALAANEQTFTDITAMWSSKMDRSGRIGEADDLPAMVHADAQAVRREFDLGPGGRR